MSNVIIQVFQLARGTEELWIELESDLDAKIHVAEMKEDMGTIDFQTAAIVLAAGGAELDAVDWFDDHSPPANLPLFVVGTDPGRQIATQLVAKGATDYFVMPEDAEIIRNTLATAIQRRAAGLRLGKAKKTPTVRPDSFSPIIGKSPAIRKVLSQAERITRHPDATALIVGETGTGKELLAKGIHEGSPRKDAPFVAINCSALPADLIESELFGHEKGAFTSAQTSKPGLFEVADGGTLFFDEIGTLPIDLQAKLLRAVEERSIRRVGGTRFRALDIRILAATNENLKGAIAEGSFREDLYYRLGVITLTLPPLRDRGEDIVSIARALLERLARHHAVPAPALTAELRSALCGYHWPGNIRELKNALERSLLLSPEGTLEVEELMLSPDTEPKGEGPIPFPAKLDTITAAAARAMVELCNNNRSEAARRLEISRRRLRRLLNTEHSLATVSREDTDDHE